MDNRNKVIMKTLSEMAWADGKVTEEEKALRERKRKGS